MIKMVKNYGKTRKLFENEVLLKEFSNWNTARECHVIGNYLVQWFDEPWRNFSTMTVSKLMSNAGNTYWERVFWINRMNPMEWVIDTSKIDGELHNLINRIVKSFG